jgi:hypothetical protein
MPKRKAMKYVPLPGSHKQRNRARHLLKIEIVQGGYKVTGGREDHFVSEIDADLTLACDCEVYKKTDICSHIIKVQMELGQFPPGPLLVPA